MAKADTQTIGELTIEDGRKLLDKQTLNEGS